MEINPMQFLLPLSDFEINSFFVLVTSRSRNINM